MFLYWFFYKKEIVLSSTIIQLSIFMKNVATYIVCILVACSMTTKAQVTKKDYGRADSTEKFDELVYHGYISANWVDSSSVCWYRVKTRAGLEYKLVDAKKGKVSPAFDQEKLCKALNRETNEKNKPYGLNLRNLSFVHHGKEIHFEWDNSVWSCDLRAYQLKKISAVKQDAQGYWNASDDENKGAPAESPDKRWTAYIKEYNVYIKDKQTDQSYQLSYDGCPGDYYSVYLFWSPDSKHLAANKIRKNEKRYIHFIQSSPSTELQPILQEREYLKPGDALPIKRPCLFDIETKKQIPVDAVAFENQFDLTQPAWWPDSKAFTFEFNQRGHQLYQVAEVNAGTGAVRILIEDRSKTFIDYSGKHFRHDVEGGHEIIWASERDGWNHLYLVDVASGQVKNQITKGEWVVREVVHINDKTREIIFKGSGKNAGEDPYFIHYYKVGFDGTGLVDLTPELREHQAVFSANYLYFTDTYSTVDIPPVTVLRSAKDGTVLMKLETADISDLQAKGWKAPEVFVAKGRDSVTDIWGNIYFPTNYDPKKSYPVIEYIYAGPQGSFVQKSFRPSMWAFSGLSELGFIIVSIDGMGTSERSKAFQDVCYKNLKDAGFPDRILWMKAAAKKFPSMDLSRVGIFGGSAGGQNALGGLLFHPEFYKAGVASCGCHGRNGRHNQLDGSKFQLFKWFVRYKSGFG